MRRRGGDTRYWELELRQAARARSCTTCAQDPACVGQPGRGSGPGRPQAAAAASGSSTRLEAQGDPRMRGEGHLFDEYPYSDESGRGFYERFMRGETLSAGWVEPTDFEKEPVE